MSRASWTYTACMVALFVSVAGCGRTQPPQSATATERVKTLEARVARLEEDYRSAAATRDQARQQAAQLQDQKTTLEEQVAKLTAALDATKADAETLRTALNQRTGERDALQMRTDRFKKGLQTLLGQDDAPVVQTLGAN